MLHAPPSKSELKRRMTALQELGEALAALGDRQLDRMPIEDQRLREALREVRSIRSNSARKRHLQYIGRLMREVDPEPLRRALADLQGQQQQAAESFHRLEQLRDRLLTEGDVAIGEILQYWPTADRQQLRQLVRQHRQELAQERPPAASRKLFRYLRSLQEDGAG
jgi:ribosome-associated protein